MRTMPCTRAASQWLASWGIVWRQTDKRRAGLESTPLRQHWQQKQRGKPKAASDCALHTFQPRQPAGLQVPLRWLHKLHGGLNPKIDSEEEFSTASFCQPIRVVAASTGACLAACTVTHSPRYRPFSRWSRMQSITRRCSITYALLFGESAFGINVYGPLVTFASPTQLTHSV